MYLFKLFGSFGSYRVYKFVVIGIGSDLIYIRVGLLSLCIDFRVIFFGGCRFIFFRWFGIVGVVYIIGWRSFFVRGLGVIDGG